MKCVAAGDLTQEEYEARRAAGDYKVIPLDELPPELADTVEHEYEHNVYVLELIVNMLQAGILSRETALLAVDAVIEKYL